MVDLRTSLLQEAIDSASDTNNDGYIIIGVVAQDHGAPGGESQQQIAVNRAYGKPFALIGCAVTLVDPVYCDGQAPIRINASATSPEFPVGSGVAIYVQEINTVGSGSAPGWQVEGNGRFFEAIGSWGNMLGVRVVGSGNTIHNSFADYNFAGGFVLRGDNNTVDGVSAGMNGGNGIEVSGNGNSILNSLGGTENNGSGIVVGGVGNLIRGNTAVGNFGDGINVSGGTAVRPNVLKGNTAGSVGGANSRNGIMLDGTGPGISGLIDFEANTAQGNSRDGFKITGSGHQLKDNKSGGFNDQSNSTCQYEMAPGNVNATGNMNGASIVAGANGSPFPQGCF